MIPRLAQGKRSRQEAGSAAVNGRQVLWVQTKSVSF